MRVGDTRDFAGDTKRHLLRESLSVHLVEESAGSFMVSTVVVLDANLHEISNITIFPDRILHLIGNTCHGTSHGLRVLRLSLVNESSNRWNVFIQNEVSQSRGSWIGAMRIVNDGGCRGWVLAGRIACGLSLGMNGTLNQVMDVSWSLDSVNGSDDEKTSSEHFVMFFFFANDFQLLRLD